MISINWQDQPLNVRRIVLRGEHPTTYERSLRELAGALHVALADDTTSPQPGDFWVGCHPRAGWGDADPTLVGWASSIEVPLAVGLLRSAARLHSTERTTPTARAAYADAAFLVAHA